MLIIIINNIPIIRRNNRSVVIPKLEDKFKTGLFTVTTSEELKINSLVPSTIDRSARPWPVILKEVDCNFSTSTDIA